MLRFAKLLFLAIPIPKPTAPDGSDIAACQQAAHAATNSFRELVLTIFPDMLDAQVEKESELAEFLKRFTQQPFELQVQEGARGNIDVSLRR